MFNGVQMLEGHEISKVSKINLIDLAGSERSTKAQTSGDRLRVNNLQFYANRVISHFSGNCVGRSQHQSIFAHFGQGHCDVG